MSERSSAIRPRGIHFGATFLIVVVSTSAGCDSFSFIPPPPEQLRDAASSVPTTVADTYRPTAAADKATAPARSIDVVLGPHQPDESEVLKAAVRSQAGLEKTRLRLFGPAEPPSTQADLIRAALAHDPHVLVVESVKAVDPALFRAIKDAQGRGITLVVVGRLPADDKSTESTVGGKAETKSNGSASRPGPVVVVAPQPFEVSARQLVATVLRGCHDADVEPGKSAILLVNTAADAFVAERVVGIKAALKAAGITTFDEMQFSANNSKAVMDVEANLKANPKTILVFSTDTVTSGIVKDVVRNDLDHRFLVAGCYAGEELTPELNKMIKIAAVASFTPTRLIRKAITTAAAIAHGGNSPGEVVFPVNVTDSVATPAMLKAQALQWKRTKEAAEKEKK